MALNLKNTKPKDAIFIGNSRTLFQISTKIMAENRIQIYNLGVSGHETSDFPSMVNAAIKYHPKSIVLSLAAPYFHSPLNIPRDVDLTDIVAYIKSQQSITYITKATLQYLKSRFLINAYATNINIRIREAYQALSKLNQHFNLKNIKAGLQNPLFTKKTTSEKNLFNKKWIKCDIFRVAYPKKMKALGMCTNGDGVLIGNNTKKLSNNHIPNTLNKPLDQNTLRLFNYLIQKIKQHHIKPIVIFTPLYQNPYPKNFIQTTTQAIQAPVINLTNMKLNNNLWEDTGHLNEKGRYLYTNQVARLLKKHRPYS